MKTNSIILTAFGALLFLWMVFKPEIGRYQMQYSSGGGGSVLRIDTATGRLWAVSGGEFRELKVKNDTE